MMQWAVLLGLSAILGVATALWHPHGPSFAQIILPADAVSAQTARRWGGHVLWIDVRAEEEYQRGHIPGALRLNEREWEKLLPAVQEIDLGGRAIVVYGQQATSDEPGKIAQRLRMIFPDTPVFTLAVGWQAWQEGGP
ncbi:MAG: rhodanese-like domain-containing protein [Phycisphaerales bacterium]|jgi:rhodanese-related sulfurtransferase|nr:rhodanese-like domain-containing protein [Phycisphaerales bacterium]